MQKLGLKFQDEHTKVIAKRGGWLNVERNGVTFSVRGKKAKNIVDNGNLKYSTIGDRLYSTWIQGSKTGKMHTARLQTEGILKTAVRKHNSDLAGEVRMVLTHSDKYVARWYNAWVSSHTNLELEQFYSYDTRQELSNDIDAILNGGQ